MNYSEIIPCDIANGEGVRVSLFVSGCSHHCPGCFNQDAQSYSFGNPYTPDTEAQIIDLLKPSYISGLSILGGDPLCQDDMGLITLNFLARKVHELGKTVWLWTGDIWDDLDFKNYSLKSLLISACDVVVDGPFIEAKKDLSLVWKGSANQRVIDVRKSIASNKVILYKGESQ